MRCFWLSFLFFSVLVSLKSKADYILPHSGVPEVEEIIPFWSYGEPYYAIIINISNSGELYEDALPLSDKEPLIRTNKVNRAFTRDLLNAAQKWRISKIKEKYKKIPKALSNDFINNLNTKAHLFDGRSKTLIITRKKNLLDFAGMIQVSWITQEEPQFTSEKLFPGLDISSSIRLHEGEFSFNDEAWKTQIQELQHSFPSKYGEVNLLDLQSWGFVNARAIKVDDAVLGNEIEFRSFLMDSLGTNDEGLKISPAPVLFYYLERNVLPVIVPIQDTDGNAKNLIGTRYFLTGHSITKNYYRKYGFSTDQTRDLPDLNVLMKTSRENYLNHAPYKFLSSSPAYEYLLAHSEDSRLSAYLNMRLKLIPKSACAKLLRSGKARNQIIEQGYRKDLVF